MKTTRLKRIRNITEKISFDDRSEYKNKFTLTDKDVIMVQGIADKYKIPYEKALSAVLRKSLDLYHWHISKFL